jgi:predicted nucleotidyltransferase
MEQSVEYVTLRPYSAALSEINQLVEAKLITDYAIGGAVASIMYSEPVFTNDLDIFFVPIEDRLLIDMSNIFSYFKKRGYRTEKDHIMIGSIPVQLLAASALTKDAVENATPTTIAGIQTKIFSPEYVIAVALQVGRGRDVDKVERLLDQASGQINTKKLHGILRKYKLMNKFRTIAAKRK